jgi:hypothetical protein
MNPLELQVARLTTMVGMLQKRLQKFEDSAQYTFVKDIQILDGRKIILGGTQGTKIGVSTSKIGFFGVTPVAQATAISAPSGGGGSDSDAVDVTGRVAINAIRTALKNIGITL